MFTILPESLLTSPKETRILLAPIGLFLQTVDRAGTIQELFLKVETIHAIGKLLLKIQKEQNKVDIASKEILFFTSTSFTDIHAVLWPNAPHHSGTGHILIHHEAFTLKLRIPGAKAKEWNILLENFPPCRD